MTKILMLALLLLSAASFIVSQKSKEAAPTSITWPFTVCEDGPWQIDSLLFSSYPTKGSELTIYAVGKAVSNVDFQEVLMDVKINGVFVYNETISFKKSFEKGDAIAFEQDNLIPTSTPTGTYVNTYSFRDTANRPVGCFFYVFKL